MKKVTCVQLPYLYCSERSSGTHIKAMPTPILTVVSRMVKAGLDVAFLDENRKPYAYDGADVVLINLHGSPYIPEVIDFEKRIQGESRLSGKQVRFVLGGEIASRLTRDQFSRLFGHHTVNGNDDESLAEALGIDVRDLSPAENVSLVPVYERLSDEEMNLYLSHNISLFLAQGCKYSCKFCSARRTRRDPETGALKVQKESYKNISIIEDELEYLILRATKVGLKKLIFYLSNLDLFQTPTALGEFAQCALRMRAKHADFMLDIRGLATVDSFLKIQKQQPRVIEDLVQAGLSRVAFGVDGMTPAVWKKIGKSHNFSGFDETGVDTKAREAIRIAKQFGITTELLMLFGHNGADSEESMKHAVTFTRSMMDAYHVIPRSFIAKDIVPGTEAWYEPRNKAVVEMLIDHPKLFQALDYLAIASPLTHPDVHFRKLTNSYFLINAKLAVMTKGDRPLYSTQLRPAGKGVEKFYGGFYDELKALNPGEIS